MAEAAKKVVETIGGGQRKTHFSDTLGRVESLLNEQHDIGVDIAEIWKAAKEHGIHVGAARFVVRLRKMEDMERNNFLRAFDVYREWANLDRQAEMFSVTEVNPHLQARTEAPAEVTEPRRPAPAKSGTVAPTAPEEAREDGAQACRLEIDATMNPFSETEDSECYEAWANGWAEASRAGEWGVDLNAD